MTQTRNAGSSTRFAGVVFIVASIVVALINNDSVKWGVGFPIALAVVGVGLRIEAAIETSRIGN